MTDKMNFFDSEIDNSQVLDKERIDEIICDINNELVERNKDLSITIYGGSALCIMTEFRGSTFDIDVDCNDSKLLKSVLTSINLAKDLVNDQVNVFISMRQDLVEYKKLSNLEVKVPTLEFLLAMKCRACREKDVNDIKQLIKILKIKSIDELHSLFNRYYSNIFWSRFNKKRNENFGGLHDII